ncbi:MAG: superoxide dismutase family protein, partial [Roseicyclus sp.]
MKRCLAATALCLAAAAPAAAQEARAVLSNQEGTEVATVALTQLENGVLIELGVTEMPAGVYAFHLHETGACSPDFEAAG